MSKLKDAIIVGDAHFPYAHQPTLDTIYKLVQATKPYFVIQMGDLYDFFHFSKYPKSLLKMHGIGSPDEEVAQGREASEAFWGAIKRASPRSKCFQLWGNHDDRPFKRLIEKCPELEVFAKDPIKQIMTFSGVETISGSREDLILDVGGQKVCFEHGNRSKLGEHMLYNEMPTVCGHSHQGGVVFKQYRQETRFELNAGFVADRLKGPLQYGPKAKKYWTTGVARIDEYGPRFIPIHRSY